jgi:digeranylgeranylglycerophospholipid reductase
LTAAWDVIVAGGGPAGLMAARTLAAARHSVLVIEEHDRIGYPVHCTGLLGLEAFDELSLPRGSIRSVLRRASFHGPEEPPVSVETDRIQAAVIDRGDFDASLAQEAIEAGARVMCGSRVEHVSVDAHGVDVTLGSDVQSIERARACVLACGAAYRFNRALGLGVPGTLVQSAQAEVPFPGAPGVDVYISRELAPDGFGWVVPFERGSVTHARVGIMCSDQARARFGTLVERVWRERGLGGPLPEPRLKVLPLAPVSRTYADRVLAVGDAAGLVKPTTGGGIYYSLLSGALAGDVLGEALTGNSLLATALQRYETLWKDRLGPDIRAGLTFRRLAARLDDRAVRALLDLARIDGLVPLLKDHGDFNWHRRAVIALLRHGGFRRALLSSIWS